MIQKKILIILITLLSSQLFAHPHMMIINRSTFDFQDNKIKGVWSEWEFDSYFSADIMMSFDINEDKLFDLEETKQIHDNAFIALKDFNYFTFIRTDSKRTSPEEVTNFSVYIADNNNIVYKFYVPLEYLGETKDLYLSVYDFSYFCACIYQENDPVLFENIGGLSPEFDIAENEDYPIYFDPYAGPDNQTVYTEWKKGLTKIIVKEIHVKF